MTAIPTKTEAIEAATRLARKLSERQHVAANMMNSEASGYAAAVQSLEPHSVPLTAPAYTLVQCLQTTGTLAKLIEATAFWAARNRVVTRGVNANGYDGETPLDSTRLKETAILLRKHGGESRFEELKAEGKPTDPVAEAEKPELPTTEKPASKPPTYVTIHDAARSGRIEFVKYFLAKGANINAKGDFRQYKPLHEAVVGRQLEIVKLLIGEGANVNAKSSSGNTPLGEAITTFRKVEVKIVELLIASGADVNSKRRTEGGHR